MVFFAEVTPVESPPEIIYLNPPTIIIITDTDPTTIENMSITLRINAEKLWFPFSAQAVSSKLDTIQGQLHDHPIHGKVAG